jgi:glyoxylase-like metal-dependent hydrolase (beta-lactamase superfamily II)
MNANFHNNFHNNGFAKFLAATALVISLALPAAAQEGPLRLKVVTSSEGSLYANFTMIMGEKELVLVDAPFTRSDAHRLVAEILETGLELKYLYITHDHPDHFFSMEVIMQAFPNVTVIAAPAVVADIWRSIPLKMERWGPLLGNNGPRFPTAPEIWEGETFELEGHEIRILGPMQGDHHNATALYVPSLDALIGGDLVFHGVHLWLGEMLPAQYQGWIDSMDKLIALQPEVVVAGHKIPGWGDDASALTFTREYLVEFSRLAKVSGSSEELIAAVRARYPEVIDVLDNFILVNSAMVATGEMPPWEE